MSFRIVTKYGIVSFRLPANIDGVLRAMKADRRIPKSKHTRQQATNVAWRVLKDWVQAQLAIVEAEMAELTQVFLPYAQDNTGRTMYEAVEQTGFKALSLK